jgi:hypothetical protein
MFCVERYGIIEASAQPLTTDIPTPLGWVKFGDLAPGDFVFSVDGEPTQVTGVFPKGEQAVYELTFNDGVVTRASGDHLWRVDSDMGRGSKVLSTTALLALEDSTRAHLLFPVTAPVEYPWRPVPLDPWLVGVLLGDGYICGNVISFSSADQEIVNRVAEVVPRGYEVRKSTGTEYSYIIAPKNRGAGYERPNIRFKSGGYEAAFGSKYLGRRSSYEEAVTLYKNFLVEKFGDGVPDTNIRQALRELGLLGKKHNEKFIPRIYMENSPDVRFEILRGIMDTDGSNGVANGAVLEQTSKALADDIEEIVRSLGGFVRTTHTLARNAKWKDSYRQNIRAKDISEFFWLPRKKEKSKPSNGFVRKLISIELVGFEEVQCIAVAHSSSLYLTNDFIVTHNTKSGKTVSAIAWLVEQAMAGKPSTNFWWVAPGYSQAEIAYKRIKQGLTKGSFTAFDTPTPRILTMAQTWIWFKSSDNADALYGEDVYAAVIDEASRVSRDSWHAVRSTLTATRGPIRIIGNVKGRKNWFYELARRAEAGVSPNMHYSKITADDAVQAGVLDAEEIEDARQNLPDWIFRELYFAEPGDDLGNPFGLEHIRACTREGLAAGPVVAWGIDLAKKQDYLVVIGLNEMGGVAAFHRWRNLPWRTSIQAIWEIVGEDTPALVDSTGIGDPVLEELQHEHGNFKGFMFSTVSKQKLMEGLSVSIQSHEITFPKGHISNELEMFEYQEKPTGVRYAAAEGSHDDCVMALGLARQMWTEVAPGANIMAFYSKQTKRVAEAIAAAPTENNRPWETNEIIISDVLDNELAELYEASVSSMLPSGKRTCVACGQPIVGATRVSDGELSWHQGCAGVTSQRPRFLPELAQ